MKANRGRGGRVSVFWLAVLLSLFLACCGGQAAAPVPSPSSGTGSGQNPPLGSPTSPSPPNNPPAAKAGQVDHVVIVVLENHSYDAVIGSPNMPYLNDLASRYSLASNFFANTHPSIGNYFMMTTGQLVTSDDSFAGTVSVDNVIRQLIPAGKTWKVYAEDLPQAGYTGGDIQHYVKRHNPFAYLTDVTGDPQQKQNLVPFTVFAQDLASGQLPNYAFVIPNQIHNAHDCPVSPCQDQDKLQASDNWLRANIDPLLTHSSFMQSGLLIITWDEGVASDTANGGGHIAVILAGPSIKNGFQSTMMYQHESLLRFSLSALGTSAFPGNAANAAAMDEFFK
jgi:acid phosphatase